MLNGHIDLKFLLMFQNTTKINTHFLLYCQICARDKYAHQMRHIYHKCQIFHGLIWEMYTNVCATYEVTAINQVYAHLTYITEQIWLPYCTYMFHCIGTVVYIQTLHYYTCLKNLVSNTNSSKSYGHKLKKINMAAECKLTFAMTTKCISIHMCKI